MTQEDLLHRYRLGTMALAERSGNERQACQVLGIHPSTYYRWRRDSARYLPEALRPRERWHPRMPNATPALVKQRVVAFSLAHPGFGPKWVSAELRRAKWGGYAIFSERGVPGAQASRAEHAGEAAESGGRLRGARRRGRRLAPRVGRLVVDGPEELVHFDCFRVGKLRGHTGGGVAVHGGRRGEGRLNVGRVARDAAQPCLALRLPAGAAGGRRSEAVRLGAGGGDDRQRQRVPGAGVPGDGREPRRGTPLHPQRTAPDQRLRGAGTRHDPPAFGP